MPRRPINRAQDFENAIAAAAESSEHYVLRLYITGTSERSSRALRNIRDLCERHLAGRYDLEVIDIFQQPELASSVDLVAAPTLIKKLPAPLRKVVGDLSNESKVLLGLDIRPSGDDAGGATNAARPAQ